MALTRTLTLPTLSCLYATSSTHSARADLTHSQERRDTTDEEATPSQSSPKPHGSQEPKQSTNMLKEIASESGLGGLFGNAHHGLGLFPVCLPESRICS